MLRAAALALVLAACGGGGGKKSEPTTIGNTGGTGDGSGSAAAPAGDARVIQRTQAGGVIELVGDRGGAMDAANEEMEAHCGPNNYTIVQEGEEAVSDGKETDRVATAWRVHYQCNGAAGPPPP